MAYTAPVHYLNLHCMRKIQLALPNDLVPSTAYHWVSNLSQLLSQMEIYFLILFDANSCFFCICSVIRIVVSNRTSYSCKFFLRTGSAVILVNQIEPTRVCLTLPWYDKENNHLSNRVPFAQWLVAWWEWPNSMYSYSYTVLPKCWLDTWSFLSTWPRTPPLFPFIINSSDGKDSFFGQRINSSELQVSTIILHEIMDQQLQQIHLTGGYYA